MALISENDACIQWGGSSVPSVLGFVTTYHREKVVPLEELADSVVPEENQTSVQNGSGEKTRWEDTNV